MKRRNKTDRQKLIEELDRMTGRARRKLKKIPIVRLQAKLWNLCKTIIRMRHGNVCFTCDAQNLEGSNWHTGHYIPSSICGAFLRYDLRNLRPQCYRCNIHLGGNGAEFHVRLVAELGQDSVNQLRDDRRRDVDAYQHYQVLIETYEKIVGVSPKKERKERHVEAR